VPQNGITVVDVALFNVELIFVVPAKPDEFDFILLGGLCSNHEVFELE
jgi:hypothetical protein